MKNIIYNGCDLLGTQKADALLAGRRLGLVTNMSGVTRIGNQLRTTASVMAEKYNLAALFGPEHGIRGAAQAGGSDGDSYLDPETGVPVYDLFSKKASETDELLSGLDALVFDIQDIGVRYYTYQYTMLSAMKLAVAANLPFIVLDRINPQNGLRVFGNLIEGNCLSGVGAVKGLPAVPGMTIGELARMFNELPGVSCELSVLACEGWRRAFDADDTNHLFVPPSPNMPALDTVYLYPGTCFFEGTNLSEGRGTTKPFEVFGAPWLEPQAVIDRINVLPSETRERFSGVVFRPCAFTPTFHKYQGELCQGIQLHLADRANCDAYTLGLYLICIIRDMYPDVCSFSRFLPHLVGTRRVLRSNFDPAAYLAQARREVADFLPVRDKYLIYDN